MSYRLNDNYFKTYWFSKQPVKWQDGDVVFEDGEIACWSKYLHREDGPAVEDARGGVEYWYDGKFCGFEVTTADSFERWKQDYKLRRFK